jgi:nitroimidazol reductase NimA-like FMN-containing flavoprotein (pyridoxamine 5'-phosphate oxidase superfamily)
VTIAYRDLSRERCLALIASRWVGRLAYCSSAGPRIYPLNFVVDGESIVFRTAAYTALGIEIDGRQAVFEVDDADSPDGYGWSVVVAGRAEIIPPRSPRCAGMPNRSPGRLACARSTSGSPSGG